MRLKRQLAALSMSAVATAALVVGVPAEAQAVIWWPAPPKCVNSIWVKDGNRLGLYSKAGEYTQRRYYGGGTEIRYIWVWGVEILMYPYGMVHAGRAERHCGTRWVPGWA